jgi:hypothetical protein
VSTTVSTILCSVTSILLFGPSLYRTVTAEYKYQQLSDAQSVRMHFDECTPTTVSYSVKQEKVRNNLYVLRPLNLREEHRLRVFENRVLRRIFGPKREEDGSCRKLHNDELHGLYSSPNS